MLQIVNIDPESGAAVAQDLSNPRARYTGRLIMRPGGMVVFEAVGPRNLGAADPAVTDQVIASANEEVERLREQRMLEARGLAPGEAPAATPADEAAAEDAIARAPQARHRRRGRPPEEAAAEAAAAEAATQEQGAGEAAAQ